MSAYSITYLSISHCTEVSKPIFFLLPLYLSPMEHIDVSSGYFFLIAMINFILLRLSAVLNSFLIMFLIQLSQHVDSVWSIQVV